MAIAEGRFCIFCGKTLDGKTREHVLPYWLLEMTGDPTRRCVRTRLFETAADHPILMVKLCRTCLRYL
jgi:hypothetical protein